MAPQSKKSNKSSSSKSRSSAKKPAQKKAPSKKRVKKKVKKGSGFKKGFFIFLGILFIISIVAFAYILGAKDHKVEKNVSHPVLKKEKKVRHTVNKKTVPKEKKKTVIHKSTSVAMQGRKPSLVIIIDDVHTRAQINAIKALPMKVTPSIFPPYKLSPNSQLLAQGLEHYMIHLPMESGNKQFNTQYKTLKISFSNRKIENRIKELRLLFPKAKYINNHTGSVFTSDYSSMHFLYKVMKENGFTFVDSRTVNSTKVREIAYSYGDVYVARDIFIDNKHSIPYIHKQLQKAVNIAKRKGYAIVIGHPHATTMQALSSAKDILKEVEPLYIDELYSR